MWAETAVGVTVLVGLVGVMAYFQNSSCDRKISEVHTRVDKVSKEALSESDCTKCKMEINSNFERMAVEFERCRKDLKEAVKTFNDRCVIVEGNIVDQGKLLTKVKTDMSWLVDEWKLFKSRNGDLIGPKKDGR